MAIRCSLLGHDYGDSEVEREREEQGNEVVVTIREEQTCSRCGKTKLVSENKEVTALTESADEPTTPETAGDVAAEPGSGGDAPTTGPAAAEGETPPAAGDGHDAEFVDEGPGDSEVPAATRDAGAAAEAGDEPEMDPEEDDAVILDADDEPEEEPERERAHGEWPDSDDTRADDDKPD